MVVSSWALMSKVKSAGWRRKEGITLSIQELQTCVGHDDYKYNKELLSLSLSPASIQSHDVKKEEVQE